MKERILLAAIKKARTMIESGDLSDSEAFALHALADFADASQHPERGRWPLSPCKKTSACLSLPIWQSTQSRIKLYIVNLDRAGIPFRPFFMRTLHRTCTKCPIRIKN